MDLHCFLRGYNEVFSNKDNGTNTYRKEWLKDRITGLEQTIEFKGVDSYQARNYMNFILFSNNDQPIIIEQNDRRYNVVKNDNAKKVEKLSFYTCQADLEPQIQKEIGDFAEVLFTSEFDWDLANTPIETTAKKDIISLSADEFDKFAEALRNGDSDYFMLNEIFPPSSFDNLFTENKSEVIRSAVANELDKIITDSKVIPATHMNKILKFHFSYKNYKESLDRLKQKGLVCIQKRLSGSGNTKVYMVTNEV